VSHCIMKNTSIRVSIVEDNHGLRESMAMLIDQAPGFELCKTYDTAEVAMRGIPSKNPDVVLMDINLPGASGIRCTEYLRRKCPQVKVIVQTVYDDPDTIFQALKAGANGYLLKKSTSAQFLEAITDVMNDGAPMSSSIARKVVQSFHKDEDNDPLSALSSREEEILGYLAKGLRNKEIATSLFISPETVRRHVHSIYTKLHVRSRTEAAIKYLGNNPG
jgi:DNA-binding NarL/FixJ family response regulator